MKLSLRKCPCGKQFDILTNEYIKYKNRYYEVSCFENIFKAKGFTDEEIEELKLTINNSAIKEKQAIKDRILKESKNKEIAKKNDINRQANLDKLYKYLKYNYDTKVIKKVVFIKLERINSGNFQGLSEGITYEDLLIMFKSKQKFLNNVYRNNIKQGKNMDANQRILYDLSILVNKYDDYKKWKEQQRILQSNVLKEREIIEENKDVNYSKIANNSTKVVHDKELDIAAILDDIF